MNPDGSEPEGPRRRTAGLRLRMVARRQVDWSTPAWTAPSPASCSSSRRQGGPATAQRHALRHLQRRRHLEPRPATSRLSSASGAAVRRMYVLSLQKPPGRARHAGQQRHRLGGHPSARRPSRPLDPVTERRHLSRRHARSPFARPAAAATTCGWPAPTAASCTRV